MESSVATLDLKIRAGPGAGRDLRAASEEFAVRVLRRCDEILERRHPGRVWIARELAMSVRLGDDAFQAGEADVVAAALADSVEQSAASVALDCSDASGEIAVFSSEAAWRAVHLELLASATAPVDWPFTSLGSSDDALRVLADGENGSMLREVVVVLHRRGSLLRVLAAIPLPRVAAIARALGMPSSAGTSTLSADVPPFATEAMTWILLTAAAVSEPERAIDGSRTGSVERAFSAWRRARDIENAPGSEAHDDDQRDGPAAVERLPTVAEPVASAFGGAFYLLPLALELGIGEALWQACLPEGRLIAEAITLLLGQKDRRDVAPLMCGAIKAWNALPDVAQEQYDEVSGAIGSRFLAAVRRRGLADLPMPVLRPAGAARDRWLVATGAGSSFVWFAEPASTHDEVQRAIDVFVDRWSASNPKPAAEPALAEFDRRARLQPAWSPSPAPLVALDGPPRTRALVTQIAGTLAHLFAARIGRADVSAPDLVTEYFAVPARVITGRDAIEVVMPADRIDIDVRRAGLDVDPGWVPWLNRSVVFAFVEFASTRPPDSAR